MSRIELSFAVIIISILMTVFISRALNFFIVAERMSVQQMLQAIHLHLQLRVLTQNEPGHALTPKELACFNPMEALEFPPQNYLGVVAHPNLKKIQEGSWYFDPESCELIYKVRMGFALRTPLPGPTRIRFLVKVQYTKGAGLKKVQDLELESLDHYHWLR